MEKYKEAARLEINVLEKINEKDPDNKLWVLTEYCGPAIKVPVPEPTPFSVLDLGDKATIYQDWHWVSTSFAHVGMFIIILTLSWKL